MLPIHRILLPIDFSPGSQAAVDLGLQIGRALGAAVTVLHAYVAPNALVALVPGASVETDQQHERDMLARQLETIAAELRASGVTETHTMLVVGPPKQTIVEQARAGHFDLVVMGTHGRTGLSRLLLGSVAEHVVRHAECPVATVHLPRGIGGGREDP
jgi:nucleotide-binding universal stress UspA family protein